MDGYSVTEAASILGVPIERVWELLARGILSGTPEGETGMRVFLQPRPAPAPPVIEARPPNGDSGSREPERELSPFRELLTEFRNLTERYGQALLALGESRGEVAALRSRVDLLEARMDLRLPMSPAPQAASTSSWPTPVTAVEPPAEPAADPHADEAHVENAHPDGEEHPRRRRGHRRATESFAEALARAEDPTRPELPGAAETAAAMAALRDEAAHDAETVLPRELPAAEPMPMPEETQDTVAEPAVAEPVADESASEPAGEGAEAEPEMAEPEMAEPEAADDEVAEPEPAQPESSAPDAVETPPAEAEAVEPAPVAAEAVAREAIVAEPAPEPEPEPIAFDPDRYTVEIIEPDWYADEESSGPSVAASASQAADAPPVPPEAEPEADVEAPASEVAEPTPWPDDEGSAQPPATSAGTTDEETMLWFGREPRVSEPAQEAEPVTPVDDGADEMEVVGAAGPRPDFSSLPGSRDLDDALEALDAVTRPPSDPSEGVAELEWPPGADSEAPASMADVWGTGAPDAPHAPPVPAVRQPGLLPSVRPPATPASRAYRRLRRIFPG